MFLLFTHDRLFIIQSALTHARGAGAGMRRASSTWPKRRPTLCVLQRFLHLQLTVSAGARLSFALRTKAPHFFVTAAQESSRWVSYTSWFGCTVGILDVDFDVDLPDVFSKLECNTPSHKPHAFPPRPPIYSELAVGTIFVG
jgi:hypothetical protein